MPRPRPSAASAPARKGRGRGSAPGRGSRAPAPRRPLGPRRGKESEGRNRRFTPGAAKPARGLAWGQPRLRRTRPRAARAHPRPRSPSAAGATAPAPARRPAARWPLLHPPGASAAPPARHGATPRPSAPAARVRAGVGRPCSAAAGFVAGPPTANLLRSLSRPLARRGAASAPQQHGGRSLRRKPGGGEVGDGPGS